MMIWTAAVKRHKQQLQRNTLVGTSLAPSAARLLPYGPSNMASLNSKMAGDDVIGSHVPGCLSDNVMYANGYLAATLDRQKVNLATWKTYQTSF